MNPGDNWYPYSPAPYAVDEIPASTNYISAQQQIFITEVDILLALLRTFNTDGKMSGLIPLILIHLHIGSSTNSRGWCLLTM